MMFNEMSYEELKAENEALKAQVSEAHASVAVLVDVLKNCMAVDITYVAKRCDAINNLQPTADAYTKRIQDEAVEAERSRIWSTLMEADPTLKDYEVYVSGVYRMTLEEIINPQQPSQQSEAEGA